LNGASGSPLKQQVPPATTSGWGLVPVGRPHGQTSQVEEVEEFV
jgi:hypothetical protein